VIPADIRADYKRLYGVAWEERWRAEPGTSAAERKRRYGEWNAEITRRIEVLRAAKRGDGINLDFKEAVALAGAWYDWFVARHEDNPGDPEGWDAAFWDVVGEMLRCAPEEVLRDGMAKHPGWERDPEVRAHMRPIIADNGDTAQFLASRGIVLTDEARAVFLDCVVDNLTAAFSLLERRAKGDYSPDELPKKFPKFSPPAKRNSDRQSPLKLFKTWVAARQPSASTITRWSLVFEDLEAQFAAPNAEPLTEDTAQTWCRSKITGDR
jgi:hypothetical protein